MSPLGRLVLAGACTLLATALAPTAAAQPPSVALFASATFGQAPFAVTMTAVGDPAAYRWDLGDGATAEGAIVSHTYERPGVYAVRVAATGEGGERSTAAISITAATLALSAPRTVRYGSRAAFRGRVAPPLAGTRVSLVRDHRTVGSAVADATGEFRFRLRVRRPGPYRVALGPVSSDPVSPLVRPRLSMLITGARTLGGRLHAAIRLQPKDAGRIRLEVVRRGKRPLVRTLFGPRMRARLPTTRPGAVEIRLATVPAPGFARSGLARRVTLRLPALARGSRGLAVRLLERRLAQLHYALRAVDGAYGSDTYEAVLAFQKTHGLPRTGRTTPGLWQRLRRARVPAPRIMSGTRLEVDKSRQLLLEVRGGRVVAAVHVSTGATGNTPLGRWRVYRKVAGWDWILWYPMYFLRGFAIHGYPSVPPYPASHGCVRVPMWFAPGLFARHPYGTTVYVY